TPAERLHFLILLQPHTRSTLFPYTTLFRSNITNQLEKEINQYGIEPLYNRLSQIDPEQAKKIHPNNHRRVIRALEIYETTGLTRSEEHTSELQSRFDLVCRLLLE